MTICTKFLFLCDCWLQLVLLSNILVTSWKLWFKLSVISTLHTFPCLTIFLWCIIGWLLLLLSNLYLLHLKVICNLVFHLCRSLFCSSSIHLISKFLLYMFISNMIRSNPQSSKYKSEYQSYNFSNAITESFMYDTNSAQNINTTTKYNHPKHFTRQYLSS